MSKMFLKLSLGLLAVAGLAWPSVAAVTGMKTLHGHVPPVVSRLVSTGRLPATNVLHLAIGLPVRNQEQLSALLQQVSDPSSPNYRHYLSPDEFASQFGPTEADCQAVADFALANGLQVKRIHANHMLIEVEGKTPDVERALNLTLNTYHHPKENRDFFAPDREPSVPSTLPVLDIEGLDNYSRPHPRIHFNSAAGSPRKGSGPGGNYMGYDFRSAYVPGTTLTGTNQKVALYEWDGYLASDIAAYEQKTGLPSVALTNVLLQNFSGFPVSSDGQSEVTLDIDMAVAMAPGLSQILVYEGDPNLTSQNVILSQIADDNSAQQVSCSWGWTGGPSGTTDQIFQQMILQGQSFFDASGDVCAFLPPGSSGSAAGSVDDPNEPNAPSDDPYITQVGATTLQTAGPGGSYVSESVWNWAIEFPGQGFDGVGSSGGISGYYSIPSWQQGLSMGTNGGSTAMRDLPDVALTGDNIYIIVNGTGEPGTGGTSCAAPLWAGFTALVNQQAAAQGQGQVGFINPAIYALAKTSSYTNYFRDVVTGNNTWSQSPANFYAAPGYDLCSGLGSPNGTNLINALAGTATVYSNNYTSITVSAPRAPWGSTLSVMNGGNPNGDWFLFVQDDTPINIGAISNGWALNLTTANPVGSASDNEVYAAPAVTNLSLGGTWTVVVAVTNYGPSISTNVVISDNLPIGAGLSLVSSNVTAGSLTLVGSSLSWSLGTLNTNVGGVLNLTFHAATIGTYTNTANVNSTTTDPNPDDDTALAVATVAVQTQPVLSGSVTSGSGNHFTFNVSDATAGTSVIIQGATNLVPPVAWTPLYTNLTPFNFTDLNATNFPARFYRAVIGP